VHQAALDAFATAQSAATERRLAAVEAIWKATLLGREAVSRHTLIYDILTREEIARAHVEPKSRQLIAGLSFDWLSKEFMPLYRDVDLQRPFVDEVLWSLHYGYRTLLGRTVAILSIALDQRTPFPFWLDDTLVREVLPSLLTTDELQEVNNMKAGSLVKTEAYIEQKIISAAKTAVSGRSHSEGPSKMPEASWRRP